MPDYPYIEFKSPYIGEDTLSVFLQIPWDIIDLQDDLVPVMKAAIGSFTGHSVTATKYSVNNTTV